MITLMQSRLRLIQVSITEIVVATFLIYQHYYNANGSDDLVNVTELDTLDRMRFTAIQMTILSLEAEQPTNLSNDEIAAEIYKYQQNNETDRLTTVQIESLYRNITNGESNRTTGTMKIKTYRNFIRTHCSQCDKVIGWHALENNKPRKHLFMR